MLRLLLSQHPAPEGIEWLGQSERARLQRFSHPRRRHAFCQARWVLRILLAEMGKVQDAGSVVVTVDEQGRSQWPERPDLHLSLSHSGPWAVAVVADHPVGVDLEVQRAPRDWVAMAEALMDEAAVLGLRAQGEQALATGVLKQWALREALLKCENLSATWTELVPLRFALAPGSQEAASCQNPHQGWVLALVGRPLAPLALPPLEGADAWVGWAQSTPKSK